MKASELSPGDLVHSSNADWRSVPLVFIGRTTITMDDKNSPLVRVPDDVVNTIYADKLRLPGKAMRPSPLEGSWSAYPFHRLDGESSEVSVLAFIEVSGHRHRESRWDHSILVSASARNISLVETRTPEGWNERYFGTLKRRLVTGSRSAIDSNTTFLVTTQAEWGGRSFEFPSIPAHRPDPSMLLITEPVRIHSVDDKNRSVVVVGINTDEVYRVSAADMVPDYNRFMWKKIQEGEVVSQTSELLATAKSRLGTLHNDTALLRGGEPSVDANGVTLPWSLVLALLGGTDEGNRALETLAETAIAVTGATIEIRSLPRLER